MSCRRAWGAKHDRVGGTFWARSTTRDEGDGRGFGSPIPLNNCACPGAPDACPAQPRRRASSRIPQQHRSDFAAPALRFRGISARIPQHQRSDSAAPALGFRGTSARIPQHQRCRHPGPAARVAPTSLDHARISQRGRWVAAEPRRSEQAPPEPRPRDQRPTSLTIKHLLPLLTSLAGSDSGLRAPAFEILASYGSYVGATLQGLEIRRETGGAKAYDTDKSTVLFGLLSTMQTIVTR
jgi:hypothetical protein